MPRWPQLKMPIELKSVVWLSCPHITAYILVWRNTIITQNTSAILGTEQIKDEDEKRTQQQKISVSLYFFLNFT